MIQAKIKMELKIPITQLENSKKILISRMNQSLDKIIEELEIF